jgi:hypothetical protein
MGSALQQLWSVSLLKMLICPFDETWTELTVTAPKKLNWNGRDKYSVQSSQFDTRLNRAKPVG